MIKKLLTVTALAAAFMTTAQAQQQRECATMDAHNHLLDHDHGYAERVAAIEEHTQNVIAGKNFQRNEVTGTITIPVIVHVVWNTAEENISDAQVQSQIDVLNEDFSATNADFGNTPSLFAGRASNVDIQFTLDQIVRVNTRKKSFGSNDDVKRSGRGGSDAITPETHMNFWVCDLGSSLLGYAQFPGGPAETDGIVGHYRYTGRVGTATAPYGLGRTATHEVGHYLNLRHIWGDGGCSVDDFVSDTPVMGGSNGGCPTFGINSCDEGSGDEPDMYMNYMDYVYDECMFMFTDGQADRMRALFEPGGARAAMVGNDGGGSGGGNQTCATEGPTNVGRQSWVYYTVNVPSGATNLTVSTSGSQGDVDLYVKYGSQPSTTDADCASEGSNSNESCSIGSPAAGTWYVGVYGYRKSNGVSTEICTTVPARGTDQTVDFEVNFAGSVEGFGAPIEVYPNPTSGLLNINLGEEFSRDAELTIYSISGMEMMVIPAADAKRGVDVSALPKGMYFISGEDTKLNILTQKFMKN